MKPKARPKYEILSATWMQHHTWSEAGKALLHDLQESVGHYAWLKTDAERRQYVLEDLVELGSNLLITASREFREDAQLRKRRTSKRKGEIDLAPLPDRPIEEAT